MREGSVFTEKNGYYYGIISAFFPIISIFLAIAWGDIRPKTVRASVIGGLIGTCIYVVAIILYIYAR
ncbi:MAG: hypothetical protein ACRDCC_09805 [Culicoidibacterales bacterium]